MNSDMLQALVLVYQKLLEFYASALEILSSKRGVKLLMAIVLEDGRLPKIVSDFLRHADHLRKLVQKATWEIVEDIKSMLYDHESMFPHAKIPDLHIFLPPPN